MRLFAIFLLMGIGLLFAASTAPPGLGSQAQHQNHDNYANHTLGDGQTAYAAPEVQPGLTNAWASPAVFVLASFLLLAVLACTLIFYALGLSLKRHRPSVEVAAGVGEACAT